MDAHRDRYRKQPPSESINFRQGCLATRQRAEVHDNLNRSICIRANKRGHLIHERNLPRGIAPDRPSNEGTVNWQ